MDVQDLLNSVQDLTDLELAVLLSLVAREHCLLTTDDNLIDDLAAELCLVVSERFGLSYKVLETEDCTSVDKFGEAILQQQSSEFATETDNPPPQSLQGRLASVSFRPSSVSNREGSALDDRMVVNVIIAKSFNLATQDVQTQALELILKGRIFSHTTVHIVPKPFLFLPILPNSSKAYRLTPHLNDRIFISHTHGVEDGFANLEELEGSEPSDRWSGLSAQQSYESRSKASKIDQKLINHIRALGEKAAITAEVRRYMQDIVTFLRLERGVEGGVTPFASTQFVQLARYLAPLHRIDFVTPSLVALAARKIYPHRITISEPEHERSMQYGSDLTAVEYIINDLTPASIVETVLHTVSSPV